MCFDIQKFKQNIEEHNVKKKKIAEDLSGATNVINHIWNRDYIDEIDFDSFSVQDAIFAMEAMESIALVEEDDETFLVDPRNPFMIYKQVDDVLFKLSTSQNKIYLSGEEEIFI